MSEEIKYIEVRFQNRNGKITIHNSSREDYERTDESLFGRFGLNYDYEYFITTNKQFRKDCKKHFGLMLKKLDKEQSILDKKRANINKLINNVKNL